MALVRILSYWNGYSPDSLVDFGSVENTRLVSLGYASYDLDGANDGQILPVTAKTDQLTGEVEISAGVMIVVSDGAPEDSDGRPDGTIYIQRG